jgi:predicted Rdx family selenoprotein
VSLESKVAGEENPDNKTAKGEGAAAMESVRVWMNKRDGGLPQRAQLPAKRLTCVRLPHACRR